MIERTKDYRRVKALSPDWNICVSDKAFYLIETDNGEDLGVICFHPCDEDGLLMHVNLGNKCRGRRAAKAYLNAFEWMFDNTECKKLLGRIPRGYRHARTMAVHIGGMFDKIDIDGLRCYSVSRTDFQQRVA